MSTPFPNSPKREQPNPHPYPIKTTSTALLSRSNSTSRSPHSSHSYTPITSPNYSSISSKQARGHRLSRSLSSVTPPPPLPLPPSPSRLAHSISSEQLVDDADVFYTPRKLTRSETLPSLHRSAGDPNNPSHDDLINILELPENPKHWTPNQLAKYLSSVLVLKNGGTLPDLAAQDVADYIINEKLNGRAFIRLSEEVLEEMGVNPNWRGKFLAHSNSLRKKAVQGRILGFGSPAGHLDPKGRVPSTVEERDERISWMDLRGSTRFSPGKVRGMVANFERTSSQSSSASEGEHEVRRSNNVSYDEEDGGFASGESSDHDRDDPSTELNAEAYIRRAESLQSSPRSEPLLTPPPAPYQSLDSHAEGQHGKYQSDEVDIEFATTFGLHQDINDETEQTVKELLDTGAGDTGSWGAKAWEEVKLGDTARKIEDFIPLDQIHAEHRRAERSSAATLFDDPPASNSHIGNKPVEDQANDPSAMKMLEVFRRRLEEVERRLDEMEARESSGSRLESSNLTRQREALPVTGAEENSDPGLDSSDVITSDPVPRSKEMDAHDDDPAPSDLPTYMLAVGLGLCAVIIRVVLRRLANRRN